MSVPGERLAWRALGGPDSLAQSRGFADTSEWIFDLDNTLYPSTCNLFAEVDRRMGEFIARYLGVPFAQARHLQKSYYHQFGTTLSGLMQVHKLDPQPFLDYVHDIDLSAVPAAPELATAIGALPGRKLIFTNGSRRHAERVAEKLGVLHLIEDICDIAACQFVPKPEHDAFQRMIRRHDVAADRAAMFEDMPHNLEAPHALGMTTVLVHSDYQDHPVQKQIRTWTELPRHIHYATDCLTGFLQGIRPPPHAPE
jgi:putative hydrolase of the HAD superfamily